MMSTADADPVAPEACIENRQWIYLRHPTGVVGPEHYALRHVPLSTALSSGEVLVQAAYISVDP